MKKFITSNLFFFILLTIVIFCVYGKTINFGLTNLDDDTLTIRHIDYISDYRNIPSFFVNGCYFDKISPYYRPLLNVSFVLEAVLFKYNLKVYHTTNVLLFILSLYLIFLFLKKTYLSRLLCLNQNNSTRTKILKCLIILFAIHPILASVPAWLPARNDSLLTVFFISSLIFFVDYLKTKKWTYFFLYLLFYTLALFTKETALLLTLIYFILAVYQLFPSTTLSPKKFFILSTTKLVNIFAFVSIITLYFFFRHNDTVGNPTISFYINNWLSYGKNIILGIMIYIKQFVFPNYMPMMLYNISLDLQTFILNLFLFSSLFFIYYKKIINRRIILFSVIFFFISIFPTFMQTEYALLFHRLIITLPAVLIFLSVIIEKFLIIYPTTKKYFILTFILIVPMFSYASFNQANKYKNSLAFWTEAYNDAPNYHVTNDGLAKEYSRKKEYQKALELQEQAINLRSLSSYYINYAGILYNMKNFEESKRILFELLKTNNKSYTPYEILSKIYVEENNIGKAIKCAQTAIFLAKERKADLYNNLSWLYAIDGQYEKSIQILTALLQDDKNNTIYYKNLAMLYEDTGEYEKAEEMKHQLEIRSKE